jgi:hypothetical protein
VVGVTAAWAPTGYQHPDYAASLAEFGTPVWLPRSGAWILRRAIPQSSHHDLMGPYPLLFCRDWSALPQDLQQLPDAAREAVSFAMVTDPFAQLTPEWLAAHFDLALPFKDHFVADLSRPADELVSKSHQATVRRALRKVAVSRSPDPAARLPQWVGLHRHLVRRHGIAGIRAFSAEAFARQLSIPGTVLFEASEIATGELVGMELWYVQGEIAYGHLAAFSDRGYALRASYATKWEVLKYFSGRARYVHLSAAAGMNDADPAADGLGRFKRGWSSGTRKTYFCGKVLDHAAYATLTRERDAEAERFFPAYRRGQF